MCLSAGAWWRGGTGWTSAVPSSPLRNSVPSGPSFSPRSWYGAWRRKPIGKASVITLPKRYTASVAKTVPRLLVSWVCSCLPFSGGAAWLLRGSWQLFWVTWMFQWFLQTMSRSRNPYYGAIDLQVSSIFCFYILLIYLTKIIRMLQVRMTSLAAVIHVGLTVLYSASWLSSCGMLQAPAMRHSSKVTHTHTHTV